MTDPNTVTGGNAAGCQNENCAAILRDFIGTEDAIARLNGELDGAHDALQTRNALLLRAAEAIERPPSGHVEWCDCRECKIRIAADRELAAELIREAGQ